MGPCVEPIAMCEKHPGQFFGLTVYGSESYFEDNSLSIFNETLPLDKWRVAFKKCDYDNSDSVLREELPDVGRHLYWGRIPTAPEIDAFMLHFDVHKGGKITWTEFMECLNNFRRDFPSALEGVRARFWRRTRGCAWPVSTCYTP